MGQARVLIESMPRKKLEDLIVRLYGHLCCDEDGEFWDEESLAADSAADFVDACNELIIDLDGGPQGDHE